MNICQDLPVQEHPAPDSLEFSEIWSGEAALLQGLRNSRVKSASLQLQEGSSPFVKEASTEQMEISVMLLFIWHIISLGDEMAVLQAATNDSLDL